MATQLAGHPIAMKVGGRRLSVSKSPPVKSYLSTSPTATKSAPGDGLSKSPSSDEYPRPATHEDGAKQGNEEDTHKKEESKHKKEKQVYDIPKEKVPHKAHHNSAMNAAGNIKQPAGKTM